jgi:hypothetical protein
MEHKEKLAWFSILWFTVFIAVSFVVPAQATLTDGLQGYWKFDGNSSDSSGYGRDLTLYGAGFGYGLLGQALNLNYGSYAARSQNDTAFDIGSGNFTIQVWVNYNGSLNYEQIAIEKFTDGATPGWTLTKLYDNSLLFWVGKSPSPSIDYIRSATLPIATNQWYWWVVRRDGSSIKMFFDGLAPVAADGGWDAVALPSENPLLLGARDNGSGGFTRGSEDEVAFWNRALTNDELAFLYNNGNGNAVVPEPSLMLLLCISIMSLVGLKRWWKE